MAIYLNRHVVSPIFLKTIEKTVTINSDGTQTTSYNSNVNHGADTTNNIIANLDTSSYVPWTRPNGWPNLDSINIPSDFEGVYLTFDNSANLPYYIASFYCNVTNSGSYVVDIGYLNNSTFTVLQTSTVGQGAYQRINYSSIDHTTYPYVVIRLTPAIATNHFTRCQFGSLPVANTGTIVAGYYYHNYCLERRGRLPWVNVLVNSSTNYGWCTMYMQKDATLIGINNAISGSNFAAAWYMGGNLREIDFTGWDTSNWTITSIASIFSNCYNLQQLDLSVWNTDKWAITTIANAWDYCYSLLTLNVSTWNTTNWRVTTMNAAWRQCFRLEILDLNNWNVSLWPVAVMSSAWENCARLKILHTSTWNTSNWIVNTLANTWYGCRVLTSLEVGNWDTENWKVTTLSQTWYNNHLMPDFDVLKNWNTTNWEVTNMTSTWYNCYAATSLGITNWITSKWAVTTFNSTWYYCCSLVHLDLSKWNTSKFAVTTFNATWYCCFSLLTLKIGTWDVSKFEVTTFANTFNSCCRLKEIEIFQWNLPDSAVTAINGMFPYCYSLKKIDFSKWTCTSWALTTIANFARECRTLEEIHMSNINVASITTANNYGATSSTGADTVLQGCYCLKVFDPPTGWRGRIYLHNCHSLPRAEIVKFFNNLTSPPLTAALYINITRHRLTAADIKIATDKGYTIS